MSETPNRTRPVLNRVIFALLTLVLGGLAGAWLFCKRRRLSFDTLGRDLVPALPLFHAFGETVHIEIGFALQSHLV